MVFQNLRNKVEVLKDWLKKRICYLYAMCFNIALVAIRRKKNDIALVAIGRRENLYAREFVEHYKNIGFSKIIIMDNNHDGEEHFEEVLQDYIDMGFVIVEDFRNESNSLNPRNSIKLQMRGYSEMYAKYKNDFGWIAFFDFDEFLILPKHRSISEFLEGFPRKCQGILINWLCMTDNNLVEYDPRPLMERFTQPMELLKPIQYHFPDNCHVKSIVKGGLNVVFGGNPHVPDTPLIVYNASGRRCKKSSFQPIDHSSALLKHFTTKTIQEWMERKMQVGTPDKEQSYFLSTNKDRFFKINEMTEDKLNYLKSIHVI